MGERFRKGEEMKIFKFVGEYLYGVGALTRSIVSVSPDKKYPNIENRVLFADFSM